jgi:hypothetical protein
MLICNQNDINSNEGTKGFTRRPLTLSLSPDGGEGRTMAN